MMGRADRTPSAPGKGLKPIGDIDYLIMSSANDEDRLAELLASFQGEYPEVERRTAIDRLKMRLEQLLSDGKVGIYESATERACPGGNKSRDLGVDEAIALIGRAEIWEWAVPTDSVGVYHLFARDSTYWGRYYGGGEKDEHGIEDA
jgi:hypothetical protein